ncbi:unnamed protein product [Paramecium primaurelia]|uniref:Uncharacterized protein n=1 Tax=Paramecium primaurelia TaxID=5886 RepID=A0A8S1QSY5_PARPR|nr:unnamed protein product [Paramecium primaurelia]
MKIGQWTELSETFCQASLVVYKGQYLNGIKCGEWNAFFTTNVEKQYKLIGGGQFDRNGVKFGKWIDLHENFQYDEQVIYIGQYQDGIKEQEFYQKKLQ